MKKKMIVLSALMILGCGFTACGKKDDKKTEATTAAAEATTAAKDTEKATEAKTEAVTEAVTEAKTEAATETQTTESQTTEQTVTEEKKGDGQNPMMNFIGNYVHERAAITVSCTGEQDGEFFVTWSSSAATHTEWKMSGTFDADTQSVSYSNCTMTNITFNEDGTVAESTVVYENGSGKFVFDGNTLTWTDDQDNVADGIEFEYHN